MAGPIRPENVVAAIPQAVFDVIDTLISRKAGGGSAMIAASVLQRDIIAMLVERGIVTDFDDANERGYLNFEAAYRANGWSVEYDKPGFNESYEPKFIFRGARGQSK